MVDPTSKWGFVNHQPADVAMIVHRAEYLSDVEYVLSGAVVDDGGELTAEVDRFVQVVFDCCWSAGVDGGDIGRVEKCAVDESSPCV